MRQKIALWNLSLALTAICGCNPFYDFDDYLNDSFGKTTIIDSHGIEIASNYKKVDIESFEAIVEYTLSAWLAVTSEDPNSTCHDVENDLRTRLYRVSLQDLPFYDPRLPEYKLAGLSSWEGLYGMVIQVGYYGGASFDNTALDHELGHFLGYVCYGFNTEQQLLDFSERHGVPY